MDTHTLAYLAGCVDCDGSIHVNRSKRLRVDGSPTMAYIVKVTIVQVNPEIPDLFRQTFGGNVYYYEAPHRENTRGWHQWYVAGENAIKVIEALTPYLHSKRKQAEVAIQLAHLMRDHRLFRNGQRVSLEESARRRELADLVRSFNVRRTRAEFIGPQHMETPSEPKSHQECFLDALDTSLTTA